MNPVAILLLAVIIGISAVATGWRLLFQLCWLLLAVLIFSYLWSRIAFWRLSILREIPELRLQVGQTLREWLVLRNPSFLPKLWIEVRDGGTLPNRQVGSVLSIPSRAERRWRRRTLCTARGLYHLGPLTISASDPFGLFTREIEAGERFDLLVYPQIVELREFPLPALELPGGTVTRRRSFQSTPNVTTVRDYLPGDSLNRVSWRATAHHQKLMVKEFDLDPVADVWIVLDLDRRLHAPKATPDRSVEPDGRRHYLNSSVEYSVTIAATVASYMLERGRSVGLLTWSGERQVLPPERGSRQLWKILEVLAVAHESQTPPLRDVLASHQQFFAGNHSLLVITPDITGRWLSGVDLAPGYNAPVTAIFVDARSFDSRLPLLRPDGAGRTGRLREFWVRNGDDIRDRLESGVDSRAVVVAEGRGGVR